MEALALLDNPLGRSNSRTPLGEPMNRSSAFILDRSPIAWHLQYWLNIGVLGILRGKNGKIIALMIEIEQDKIPDGRLRNSLRNTWNQFWNDNKVVKARQWEARTMEDEEAQQFLRDIDRMFVDKVQKVRSYLSRDESTLRILLRQGEAERAKELFEKLSQLYPLLREE